MWPWFVFTEIKMSWKASKQLCWVGWFFFLSNSGNSHYFFLKCCCIFISLVQIKELESELVKATSQLSMEKRRTSSLEVSLVLYSNFNSQGK